MAALAAQAIIFFSVVFGAILMIAAGLTAAAIILACATSYFYKKYLGARRMSQIFAEARRQGRPLKTDDTPAH